MRISKLNIVVFLPLLIALFSSSPIYAGKYAGAFLENEVGARALGMGGAFGALADDGTAVYWNPAGLSQLQKRELSMMHAFLFGSLANYDFLSYAQPLPGEATIAASWIRLSVDDIPEFSELSETSAERMKDRAIRGTGEPIGYFNDREDAFIFSFAKMFRLDIDLGWQYFVLPTQLSLGTNLKVIRQELYTYSASAIGLDLGALLRFSAMDLFGRDYLGDFSLALNFQDVSNTEVTWTTKHEDVIPYNVKWGLSYTQPIPWVASTAILSFDRDSKYGGENHIGLEYWLKQRLAMRLGWNRGSLTAGAGVKVWILELDYAFVSYELGNTHRISGAVRF